jgi:hypothetical protein
VTCVKSWRDELRESLIVSAQTAKGSPRLILLKMVYLMRLNIWGLVYPKASIRSALG